MEVNYKITEHVLTLFDSYRINKWRIKGVLENIKKDNPWSIVWDRSMFSLVMETVCHDFLYEIGYQRERTKDTDLDNPCDHPEWMYILGGLLVWLFVW